MARGLSPQQRAAIVLRPCPECSAPVGEPCRDGSSLKHGFHSQRRAAAETALRQLDREALAHTITQTKRRLTLAGTLVDLGGALVARSGATPAERQDVAAFDAMLSQFDALSPGSRTARVSRARPAEARDYLTAPPPQAPAWTLAPSAHEPSIHRYDVRIRDRDAMVAVTVQTRALEAITDEVRCHPYLETGGILLGRLDGTRRTIIDASVPGPNAVRKRDSYRPDLNHDRAVVARASREWAGDVGCVGSWHSHPAPGGSTKPSHFDAQRIAELAEQVHRPLLCLATRDPLSGWRNPRLTVWIYTPAQPGDLWAELERATVMT
jgi:integrative and conjugative element protein (TIGR02256 family)